MTHRPLLGARPDAALVPELMDALGVGGSGGGVRGVGPESVHLALRPLRLAVVRMRAQRTSLGAQPRRGLAAGGEEVGAEAVRGGRVVWALVEEESLSGGCSATRDGSFSPGMVSEKGWWA